MHPYGLPWLVLGPTRLHHTIVTGAVTSKTGGGRWALEQFDARWHPVIRTCLDLRRGAPLAADDLPDTLWADGVAFAALVVEEGIRRAGP